MRRMLAASPLDTAASAARSSVCPAARNSSSTLNSSDASGRIAALAPLDGSTGARARRTASRRNASRSTCRSRAYVENRSGSDVRARQAHRHHTPEPRRRGMVEKSGIAVELHPAEVVVDGVIDAVAARRSPSRATARRDGRGRPCSRSRSRAAAAAAKDAHLPCADGRRVCAAPMRSAGAIPRRRRASRRSWVGHVARGRAASRKQRRHAAHAEVRAGHGDVAVQVGDRVLLQIGGVLLGPLGRADQPVLLGVPARDHDGAPRRPAALQRRAEARAPSRAARRCPSSGRRRHASRRRGGCRRITSFSGSTAPGMRAITL